MEIILSPYSSLGKIQNAHCPALRSSIKVIEMKPRLTTLNHRLRCFPFEPSMSVKPLKSFYKWRRTLLINQESHRRVTVVAKAVGEKSDSSASLSIVKTVQNAWDKSEDRPALVGLGFAAIVAVWASSNLIGAIDRLPVIPTILEVIGILYSWWFVYRFLLFKPDREELSKVIKDTISNVLDQ